MAKNPKLKNAMIGIVLAGLMAGWFAANRRTAETAAPKPPAGPVAAIDPKIAVPANKTATEAEPVSAPVVAAIETHDTVPALPEKTSAPAESKKQKTGNLAKAK